MQGESTIDIFKKNFLDRIRTSFCKRSNYKDKCFSAFVNEKSEIKKIGILIGQEIFDENGNYNMEKILNDNNIDESIINFINNYSMNSNNSEEFNKGFLGISSLIEFFYQISKLYAALFLHENDWYSIFICFLFKKKYVLSKEDFISSIKYIIGETSIKRYTYEDLLKMIKEKYESQNDIKLEFVKIFMNNKIEYLNKINEKLKMEPKNNLKELELRKKQEIDSKIKDNNYQEKSEEFKIDITINPKEDISRKNISLENINTNIAKPSEIDKIIENKEGEENQVRNINHNNLSINKDKIWNEKENKKNSNFPNKENINTIENLDMQEDTKITSMETNITHINELKENLVSVKQYLSEKLKQYKQKGYPTNLLEYKLNNNLNFFKSDISYLDKANFEPNKKINDRVLKELLAKLSLNNIMPNTSEYGYFCYLDPKKGYIEALYCVINPELLYDNITKVYKGDDVKYPNKKLQEDYIRSRAKCFEYYIDKTVFEKRYKNKQFPRIIFPLKKLYKISPFKYNRIFYECEKEIDGCFYINNTFTLDKNEFPFESQFFKSYFANVNDINDNTINSEDGDSYTFLSKDLCFIEIKTHFPDKNNSFNKNDEKDLYKTVQDMLKNMTIFEQLFESIGLEYERIRLILFYDLIRKKNYEDELKSCFKNFFTNNFKKLKYLKKIYFQIIYIDSSYFAETLKSFQDKIDNLEFQVSDMKSQYDAIQSDNKDIKEKYDVIKGQYEGIKREYDTIKLVNKNIKMKYDEIRAEKQKNDEILKVIYDTLDTESKNKIDEILKKK